MKKALIFGVTGQDGSYLSELLLEKGYEVYGVKRRSSSYNTSRIDYIYGHRNFNLVYGDVTDSLNVTNLISSILPDEIYNLAAQSHVKVSFDIPEYTANVDALGTLRILESIRLLGLETHTRFYQACYDEQTKVFTNNGIKTFSEIDKNDKVFTINEITHKLELKPIDKIHVYDFSGEMIKISGKRIDLLVTPNHKLILKYDNEDVLKYCDADNLFTELNKTEKSNISLPKTKFSVDTHNKTINLKDYFDFNFKKNHTMNLIESIETNDLLYLIDLYIVDGYFGSKKKYILNSLNAVNRDAKGKFSKGEYIPKEIEVNSGWICFAIPKKDKSREELEYILNKNNIKFTAKDNTIEFSSYVLSEIFRTCGCGAKNKNIPEWAFNFPNESLIRLSDGLVGSDGHKRKNKIMYTTISQKLANDVVRLYTYLGYYSTLTCRKPRLGKIGDREFKTANITYYITINYNSTDNKIYKQYISKENYIGKVWCLTVKDNHNFMVLRGNKICFSGNSTSELYGLVQEIPQTETTPFYPRSPYACAKIFGYWIVKNYREAYHMFACNGILFNHETISSDMPLIFKEGTSNDIDIKTISEIVKYHTNKDKISIDNKNFTYQETEVSNELFVWDNNGWTKVKFASGYPHKNDRNPRFLVAKNAAYLATGNHVCIMDDGKDKEFKNIELNDKVNIIEYPIVTPNIESLTKDEARLIGYIVGDGCYRNSCLRLTGKNLKYLEKYANIWKSLGGTVKIKQTTSGFTKRNDIFQYHFRNNVSWILKNLNDIYDENRKKRIPKIILNSSKEIQLEFLYGYNDADGLKSNNCVYEFKNFKTNSSTLAAGLLYLLNNTTKQEYNINVEYGYYHNKFRAYYSLNILSSSKTASNKRHVYEKYNIIKPQLELNLSQRELARRTGISRDFIRKVSNGYVPTLKHHFQKDNNMIKKIIEIPNYDGWFYDLETESGTFHCGIGQGHVHNSPRRGETFVTRKITIGLNAIKNKQQNSLYLGNLNALRDWSHAKDMVNGMWMMLQHKIPDDFVLASGKQYSVKQFVERCAPYFVMDIVWEGEGMCEVGVDRNTNLIVIRVDPKYFRPTEVETLLGNPAKAKRELGWEPTITFDDLVQEMCEYELGVKNV